jgi:hypothetical protein
MKSYFSDHKRETFLAICLVVLATLLTYGTQLSGLGFYRDDWYLLWTAESLGREGLLDLFRGDRPFVGWLYVLDFSILGVSPINWHLYALFIKILSALGFFWLMRMLWPQHKLETTFVTLLFVVYPGFYQQPNALTYKQLLLAYTAAIFSLVFTVYAIRAKQTVKTILFTMAAVLLFLLYVLIYEALVGIEAVRLGLIFYILNRENENWKQSVRQAFTKDIPYILLAVLFVFWRIFVFDSTRRATNADLIASNYTSLHGVLRLLVDGGKDIVETTVFAWGVPFYQFALSALLRDIGLALGVSVLVVAAGALYYFLSAGAAKQAPEKGDAGVNDWILIGVLIIIVTTFPIVAAGRHAYFNAQWDRYTYQSAFGVAILIGGFVFYALRGYMRRIVLTFLLVIGVSTQVFSAIYYRNFWTAQRDVWRQLSWRAPHIEDGTTLVVAAKSGFGFFEEYEIWGPVNLAYNPGGDLKVAGQIFYEQLWLDLERGTVEERLFRGTLTVPRDYNNVVLISAPSSNSCLHLFDGNRGEQYVTETLSMRALLKYSNSGLVDVSGASVIPYAEIFGDENERPWCYYYQNMDKARQAQDWQAVADLAEEAIRLELSPKDVSEWMPALEAYLNLGDDRKAKQMARWISYNRSTHISLCTSLKMTLAEADNDNTVYDRALLNEVLCSKD